MKRISLKVKMSLWYTLLVAILLLVFLPTSYFLLSNSLMSNVKAQLKDDFSTVQNDLDRERPDKRDFEKDNFNHREPVSPHEHKIKVVVFNEENEMISSDIEKEIKKLPRLNNEYWQVKINNQDWLVYNKKLRVMNKKYDVRIVKSIQNITSTLNNVKIGLIISVPIILGSAFIIGLLIARRALKPIYDIADTAQEIEAGNRSLRLVNTEGKDEIATLSKSFNSMVDYLEDAITREQQFSVDASHELRTPLAIILNYSDELLKTDNKEELHIINNEAIKMKKIISQLLMLARGELNQYNLDIELVSLNDMLDSIIEQMRMFAKDKNIKIEFKHAKPIMVNIDESLWTQLFINLIDNALKYTPDNGEIRIETKEKNNLVTITIEDNGIGINEKDLQYIFERFYQVDASHHSQGVGLGLSLVKWIIDIHNAKIDVESQEGKGTKFIISIQK